MLIPLIKELRPNQWIKNLIIAGPLFFSLNAFNAEKVVLVAAAIALFCAVASAVYLINDIADLAQDRLHPKKKFRPLAAGQISIQLAWVMAIVLGLGSVALASHWDVRLGIILGIYLASNLLYSFRLKHVVILDVMTLAVGFVLRVLAGALVIGVPTSVWLIMCTLLLSLFLGFAKRRHELVLLQGEADSHRQVLAEYSPELLDQLIIIVTTATVVSYALYTMAPHTVQNFGTDKLIYTVPFVLYGIFRYLYLVHRREEGGNPSKVLFSDAPILVTVLLWLVTCGLIIYRAALTRLLFP